MTESSLPWAGSTIGDAGPYTDDAWSDMYVKLFQSDRTTQGPIIGMLNQLAISNPSGTTLRVASGYAIVDGKIYTNTSDIDFSGAVPASGSNFYRIVLRKNFTSQTVRLALLGPDPAAPPAVTQTDGTTWEISLATIEITSTAVVTITDIRSFCIFNSKVADNSIVNEMIAGDTITPAKIANRTRQFLLMPDSMYTYVNGVFYYGYGGAYKIQRMSPPSWAWWTRDDGQSYFKAMFFLPQDYYSNLKISALWASHSSNQYQIAVRLGVAYLNHFSADQPVEIYKPSSGFSALVMPPVTGTEHYIDSWGSPAPAKGDYFDMIVTRDALDPLDNGMTFVDFVGFLVTYTADS